MGTADMSGGGVVIFPADLTPAAAPADAGPPARDQPERPTRFDLQLCRTNDSLNLLSDTLLKALSRDFTLTAIRHGDVLIGTDSPLKAILFPLSGLYSVVRTMADGSAFEVLTSGRTCRGGISILFGDTKLEAETIALLDGTALSITPTRFRAFSDQYPELTHWLEAHAAAAGLGVQRSEGCNARHTLEQRLARWLLNASDESHRADLAISQETIAKLLGVRRSGINEALSAMRERGLVETGRSLVTLVNRRGLISRACECYREDAEARLSFRSQARRPAPTVHPKTPQDQPPYPTAIG